MDHRTTATTPKPKLNTQPTDSATAHRKPRFSALTAALAGAAAAIPLTLAAVVPIMESQMSTAVAQAHKTVSVKAADDTLACSQPSGSSAVSAAFTPGMGAGNGGQVMGASTVNTPSAPFTPGMGAGNGGNAGGSEQNVPPVIQKIIGGSLTATNSISGVTGPNSYNSVSSTQNETVSVQNNNNISVSNSNNQSASSGDATVRYNTEAGSATSGDATNNNSTDLNLSVSN